ncbi:MAG: SWIM zinc finger family protein [Kiritimatiellae bacterium]|nr:SWIM zinc finger family protein [Kiritimatiellia bacterium]
MGRYGYYSYFPQQMTKWEKSEKAAKTIARLTKKGQVLSPVPEFSGRIAKTFWGKAWCDNIESYRDFEYRLERGRSYVRSGAVIDLQIASGKVTALVIGSGRNPYEVVITIKPMVKGRWDELVKRSAGKISSLMALAQGKLPSELLQDFCNPETGLFPKPREIQFDCSCPDGANCCKHVAAVLYGIGARLDVDPTLFFTLRGIDPASIVGADVVDTLTEGAASEIAADDLGDVFGIALDGEIPVEAELSAKEEKPKASVVRAGCQKKSEVTKVPVNSEGDDGALMKSVRLRLGLSQAEMGRRLGTYQAVVSQIERGKARLRKGWAERLRGMA